MGKYTLTMVDVRRVQHYLFQANELKQSLGASALVEQATQQWLIAKLPGPCNVEWDADRFCVKLDETIHIDNDGVNAEVIFIGGGNAAILFASTEQARTFAQAYSRHVLAHAPRLGIAIGHVCVDLSQPSALDKAWQRLQQQEMPKRKQGRAVSQALLGLGVTAACVYSGLPAVEDTLVDADAGLKTLVSAEVLAKRNKTTVDRATDRLNQLMPPKAPFEYPSDFDDLGGDFGHSRYIAVVHADGNSMGRRIQAYCQDENNRNMITKMREFSDALNEIGLKAMQSVCDWLRIAPEQDPKGYKLTDRWVSEERVRFNDDYLPVRPIVFGGDDVTFVCDGRLGFALATKFLQVFSDHELPDGKNGFACAGVAIVHTHYPFARAYALASDLAEAAKRRARQLDPDGRVSLINWHYASSGLTLDWKEIQQREYQDGNLHLRPLTVAKADGVSCEMWRMADTFLSQLESFRKSKQWSRGKLKELQDALREGKDAVNEFVALHQSLPSIQGLSEAVQCDGWYGGRCLYFDALEANDILIYPREMP